MTKANAALDQPAPLADSMGEVTRNVVRVLTGQPTSDGAGVKLTRVIGTQALPDLDPFLMLDEFRSDDPQAYLAGFPDHPHRGFETVTYMLAGRMRHHDNKGNKGLLGPGSVQWMTAARGIVHSEMPEQQDGLMQGFQLWINLPAAEKMSEPRYKDIPAGDVPVVTTLAGAKVKVVAGKFAGKKGPVAPVATAPLFLDIELPPGASFETTLPAEDNAFTFVFDGTAEVGAPGDAKTLQRGQIGLLGTGSSFQAKAGDKGTRLLLLAGRPLKEPVAKYGPFVMNTTAELHQAVADFQAGRF
ncbi:MAG TPA: pirin family protein [Dongiaceae bacterium]|nr:pirin family protein [Dongiaceae bacterium]